jgi:archaellum component FlaD/FlaE/archaellum component FlaC
MDLGDVMRELGLDAFGSSSASRAPSQEQAVASEDLDELENFDGLDEDVETNDVSGSSGDAGMAVDETIDDGLDGAEADSEIEEDLEMDVDDSSGSVADDHGTDEILDRLDDISYEIDQLSADVGENQSTIRTLRNERQELRERMESIEENNATMLGIYDRLTNEINPFAADWDERYDQKVSEQDGPKYGVIEPPENELEVRRELHEQRADESEESLESGGEATTDSVPDPDEDDAVSFDDLKHKHDDADDAVDETEDGGDADEARVESDAENGAHPGDRDPSVGSEVDRHENESSADGTWDESEVEQPPIDPSAAGATVGAAPEASDGPYLSSLAPTVATEVLIMEWLTLLIDIAGPAGAMKALDFYERIGWISAEIKWQLEDVLSGAHERGDPPSRPPSDLTAEEHNQCFAHIVRLAQQAQLARSREG